MYFVAKKDPIFQGLIWASLKKTNHIFKTFKNEFENLEIENFILLIQIV